MGAGRLRPVTSTAFELKAGLTLKAVRTTLRLELEGWCRRLLLPALDEKIFIASLRALSALF